MPQKFNRNYKLYADTVNASLIGAQAENTTNSVLIQPPFTLEFDVVRDNLASVNRANFTVYNLGLATRTLIHKDIWETDIYRPIELWAGYGNGEATPIQVATLPQSADSNQARQLFPRIFRGNITRAYSYRQGVNFLTKFECQDAGYAAVNGKISRSYIAGTLITTIIEDLVNAMPTITLGAISPSFIGKKLLKGNTFIGDPKKIVTDITGGFFFIDNEKAYILKTDEYIQSSIPTISSENGILGVPIKESTLVHLDMIFAPELTIGQSVKLDTKTVPYYNGLYQLTGLSHRGVISEAVCGTAVSSLTLTALPPNAKLVSQL